MDYTNIKQVQEVACGAKNGLDQTQLVNAYLALGWMLIAVHQRGDGNTATHAQTVYILASPENDARHPKGNHHCAPLQDDSDGADSPYTPGAFLWG